MCNVLLAILRPASVVSKGALQAGMRARQGNNPKRRIAPSDRLELAAREALAARLVYVGSSYHKLRPGDYSFHPPVSPRPWKSVCDGRRIILKDEAARLFRAGIMNGMFSNLSDDGMPKYVWAVDADGEVYEAKTGIEGYHGYRLEEEDDFRAFAQKEWEKRCRAS
jgi:hypothetical protein